MNKHKIFYPALIILVTLFSINSIADKQSYLGNHTDNSEFHKVATALQEMSKSLEKNTELLTEMNKNLQRGTI